MTKFHKQNNVIYVEKKKFLMSLKNWWSMAYTVCHVVLHPKEATHGMANSAGPNQAAPLGAV